MNLTLEKSIKAWFLRAAFGPALLIDGLIATFTLATFNINLSLKIARSLTRVRINKMKVK